MLILPPLLVRRLCSRDSHTRRSFISLAPTTSTHQTLHARRTLPYHPSRLYAIIADIESYPTFLPYCTAASVTARTQPHPSVGTSYPRAATLTAGWGAVTRSFLSRVYCVPERAVEAVAGAGRTSLPRPELLAAGYRDADVKAEGEPGELFDSLRTKWAFRAVKDGTEVELKIDARWNNPMLAAVSQGAAPQVADLMVEAFERRAREVLG